jgi:hypothetical protein
MSKSGAYQKTTTNIDPTSDPTQIVVNGTDLTTAIANLASANAFEEALLSSCAFVDSPNNFSQTNTFSVLNIPNVATFNSSNTTNTVSGKMNFSNTVNLQSDTNVGKTDNSSTVNVYGTTGLHGTTSFDSIPSTTTDQTANITTNNQLVNKKYVDNKVSAVLSANNTFSGQNNFNGNTTFNSPINLQSNVTIGKTDNTNIIAEYGNFAIHGNTTFDSLPVTATDLSATITDDKQIVPKKYVDDALTNSKASNIVWTGAHSFNNNVTLGTTSTTLEEYGAFNVHGQLTLDKIPIMYTDKLSTITDDKQLVQKNYVDGMTGRNNVWSGTNTFNNDVQLGDSSTAKNISQYGNFAIHGSTTFDSLPVTATDLTVNNDKQLVPKKYVDSKLTYQPTSDTIIYGQQAIYYSALGSYYVVEAPYLGTSTVTNSTGTYVSFYVNFPATSSSSPIYTLYQNNVTFDFNYWFYQPTAISGSFSTSVNTASFTPNVPDQNIGTLIGIAGLTNIQATFNVTIRNGGLLVHSPYQTTKIWTNNTTTANSQAPVTFNNNYINNTITMSYYPIQFAYVNNQKFRVTVGFPCQANNPTKSYWIANLGYSAQLRSSMPCTSTNFAQGNPQLTPNSGVNSLSGGAWISTS